MTDPIDETLAELHQHVNRLARDLPGPLRRIQVCSGPVTMEIEWQQPAAGPGSVAHGWTTPDAAPRPAVPVDAVSAPDTVEVAGGTVLDSPMVGTFYRSSGPSEPHFIEVGDVVEEGQTVGIIEAMKLFNLITAEFSGVVREILVGDGESVEFGQPLVRLMAEHDTAVAGVR